MPIYLVRHGETRWNVERRLQGRTDSPLTLRGLDQIRDFGSLLRGVLPPGHDTELWSSPLPRARQTASMIGEILELPSTRCFESQLLAERYCGAWEGMTLEEIQARDGSSAQAQYRLWDLPIGGDGETLAQVYARARTWLALPKSATHVIVVTHGILSRQFRGAYLGLAPEATMALESHAQDRIYRLEAERLTTLHASDGPDG